MERSSWRFGIGDRIDPARVAIRSLGSGSGHETYLAWDDDLYAPVVVRILRPASAFDDASREDLRAAAAVLTRCSHPALPRLVDAVLEGERPHLVIEYVEGPSLATVLESGPLEDERLLAVARMLCSVLHHMARADWVHLGIGPHAVVMGRPPRLLAPGSARAVRDARRLREPAGEEDGAPETRDRSRFAEIGPATDVWSLGALLLVAAGRPDHVLPAPLADVLAACLDDDPAVRPSAASVDAALAGLATQIVRDARETPDESGASGHQESVDP